MAIAARLRVSEVLSQHDTYRQIRLTAVYSDDKESPNYSFSQATPSATLDITITNPAAFNQFEIGKVFDVLFTEYKEPATA